MKPLLVASGFRPRRSLGQNFLHDPRTLRFLQEAADLSPEDHVLEIGTGPGLLTQYLADVAGEIWSVEVDAILHGIAARMLRGRRNVHLIHGDILRGKHEVDPAILRSIPGGSIVHVSNLPYAIAVPAIIGLLEGESRMDRMVVTVQREIGTRMTAPPGGREYGLFGVVIGLLAEVEILREVAPGAFWPRPEVHSAILRVRRRAPPPEIEEYVGFKRLLRGLFSQRRKTILRALIGNPGGRLGRPAAEEVLATAGIDPRLRVEGVSPQALLSIHRAVRRP